MKKLYFLSVLAAALLAVASAQAQKPIADQDPKPEVTSSGYIAMAFYKLSGGTPDFKAWAESSKAYNEASPFDKDLIRERQMTEIENIFSLFTLDEPIVLLLPAKLSEYSITNKGFFIENIKEDTFFPVSYVGNDFAVIPQNIMDHQWVRADDKQAKIIDQAARNIGNRTLHMYFHLTPIFADKAAPLNIEGINRWLLLGEVQKMTLVIPTFDKVIWTSQNANFEEKKDNELLDLYQK
jgi:hypothetical protein